MDLRGIHGRTILFDNNDFAVSACVVVRFYGIGSRRESTLTVSRNAVSPLYNRGPTESKIIILVEVQEYELTNYWLPRQTSQRRRHTNERARTADSVSR